MSDAPRTLDYATDVNADLSAARYLRWVVSGMACAFAFVKGSSALILMLMENGWLTMPANTTFSVGVLGRFERATMVFASAVILLGAMGIAMRRRWAIWLLLATFAFLTVEATLTVALSISSGTVFLDSYPKSVRGIMGMSLYCDWAALPIVLLLFTTPPMARLMRLR